MKRKRPPGMRSIAIEEQARRIQRASQPCRSWRLEVEDDRTFPLLCRLPAGHEGDHLAFGDRGSPTWSWTPEPLSEHERVNVLRLARWQIEALLAVHPNREDTSLPRLIDVVPRSAAFPRSGPTGPVTELEILRARVKELEGSQ